MLFKKNILIYLTVSGLFFLSWTKVSWASSLRDLKVLEASARHLVLEIQSKPPDFPDDRRLVQKMLTRPMFSCLLGVPAGVDFKLKILSGSYSYLRKKGGLTKETKDDPAPGNMDRLQRLEPIGWCRTQRLARLTIQPMVLDQSNRKVRFYRKLVLRIDFPAQAARTAYQSVSTPDSPSFEKIFQYTLVNYESARSYRAVARPLVDSTGRKLFRPGTEVVKIFTSDEGLYRIGPDMLRQLKVDPGRINPESYKLYGLVSETHGPGPVRLEEIPIRVVPGPGPDSGGNDHILFYALRTPERYDRYTKNNVYWLSWGQGRGSRMVAKKGLLKNPVHWPESFKTSYHAEENHEYLDPPATGSKERWFWARLSSQKGVATKRYFTIRDLPPGDTGKEFTLRVSLQGLSNDIRSDPDHHLIISFNDHLLKDIAFNAQERFFFEGRFPGEWLVEGDNVLKLESPGDLDVFVDQVLLDWFELEWWTSSARNGSLKFVHESDRETGVVEFRCRNFKEDQIYVLDISDKFAPKIFEAPGIEREASKCVVFHDFFDAPHLQRSYLTVQDSRVKTPVKMEKVIYRSDLLSPDNQADYLIITHQDFLGAADRLADYRRQQGLRVKVINVADIYNLFSHGLLSPSAIRDFINYICYHWQKPAPSYVLLVGDANWDYKNNLGYNVRNYVPSTLIQALGGKDAASDNWLVCVNGDDALPDLHLGRFPAASPEEVHNLLDKTIQFESGKIPEFMRRKFIFVADDKNPNYSRQCDFIIDQRVPKAYESRKYYLESLGLDKKMPLGDKQKITDKKLSAPLLAEINKGCALINFVGHGGLRVWSHKSILDSRRSKRHWELMRNQGKYPLVFAYTCLNGYFDSPRFPTIAERFVNEEEKGAVAVFTCSRDSNPMENWILNSSVMEALFDSGLKRIGPVLTASRLLAARDTNNFTDHLNMYIFFGDPALKLSFFNQAG